MPISDALLTAALGGAAGALITSVLTQLFQFWHTAQAYERQKELARLADARALRDAQVQRLRETYRTLLTAVNQIRAGTRVLYPLQLESETRHQQATRQQTSGDAVAPFFQAIRDAVYATITLKLESASTSIVAASNSFTDACGAYGVMVEEFRRAPSSMLPEDLAQALTLVDTKCIDLEALLRTHVDTLERPL